MNILVSICCISYNHEKFIAECIEGFLMQKTDFPFEILIFDDASTDKTQEIIEKYSSVNKHIKTYLQKENQWKNKKYGQIDWLFPSAKGKYIALCEGDDYWTDPLKLKKQIELMEATNSEFCYSDFDILFQEKKVFEKKIFANNRAYIDIKKPLLTFGHLGAPTWVFSSSFLKNEYKLNQFNVIDGSVLMLIEFLRKNGKVCFLEESTAVYRRNINSASNQQSSISRYKIHKISFEFMLDYFLRYYVEDEQTRHKINMLSINIVSEAHDNQDVELINRIKSFLKESEIDITQILNKFNERDKYKANFEFLENSKLRRFIKLFKK